MTTRNLVLIGLLKLEHGNFFRTALLHDFTRDFGFGGVRSGKKLFVFRVHRENGAKGYRFSDIAANSLNPNGIAGRDTILLSPGFNDRVHHPSSCKGKL
jgi:hypothetical protein